MVMALKHSSISTTRSFVDLLSATCLGQSIVSIAKPGMTTSGQKFMSYLTFYGVFFFTNNFQ